MTIQYLPDNFFDQTASNIQLYNYNINNARFRNKITLTKNVFSFLMEGTKELLTKDTTTTIDNRQFLLIKSGHCLMSEKLAPSHTYRSMLLFFSDEAILNFMEKHKINSLANADTTPYHVCNYDVYIQHFVQSLIQIEQYTPDLRAKLLETKFEEIMVYLLHKKGRTFLEQFLSVQNDYIKHFKSVVESNTLNNLTIQELAFLCNMSISTFKREFEKYYQESPIKWFAEKRLEHAAFLLKNKAKRPTDIYNEIGFESLSSFTQSFKQKYGATPKKFQLETILI